MLMSGYWEEKWYSQFMVARCTDWMGGTPVDLYMHAYEINPARAEPLFYAADWYRRHDRRQAAMVIGRAAIMPQPEGLFVEADVYDWRVLDLIATVGYYTKDRPFGKWAVNQLLRRNFPEEHRARIEANAKFY
jgi:hypothetical protein